MASAAVLTKLASIISISTDAGVAPPTGISSSAGANFSFSNAALDNTTLTTLQLTGGTPQGTGAWTIEAGSWAKVRLSAATGTSTQLRIDDPDDLAAGDNGTKNITVIYDGEGLGSPLEIDLVITITTISVPSGARAYLHKPKWLPKNDADFVFWNVDADNDMNLPVGDATTRKKILVINPPNGEVRKSRSNQKGLSWGGVIGAGFDHMRQGTQQWAGPKGDPTPRWAGHFLNISFAAGSSQAMPAGLRPFLWLSNHRFRRHATNGSWGGDYLRAGTAQVNDGANRADYHDLYFQKCHFDVGHLCWDAATGDAAAPHSDLIQFANGGGNDVFVTDCEFVWNGLSIYLLDSGNIANAPNRTKSPQGARFWFQRCTMKPQADPFGIDNGTWRYYTQARVLASNGNSIWNLPDGLWRAMYIQDVGFWVPVGHGRRNNLPGAFATPAYPEPTLVTEAGNKWLRWLNPNGGANRLNGDKTVMLDRQCRFYENEGDMPEYIDPADTGSAWRFTTVAQIRGALQTPETVLV